MSAINRKIRNFMLEDTASVDSAIVLLASMGKPNLHKRIVGLVARKRDSSISRNKSFQSALSADAKEFSLFLEQAKKQSGKLFNNASQNYNHEFHIWSKAVLKHKNGEDIPELIELPSNFGNGELIQQESFAVNIYPNPANDIIVIDFIFDNSIQMDILSLEGSIVKTYILLPATLNKLDVSQLKPGTYLLNFTDDDIILKSEKVSIFH